MAAAAEAAIDRAYEEEPTKAEKKWLSLTRRKRVEQIHAGLDLLLTPGDLE